MKNIFHSEAFDNDELYKERWATVKATLRQLQQPHCAGRDIPTINFPVSEDFQALIENCGIAVACNNQKSNFSSTAPKTLCKS